MWLFESKLVSIVPSESFPTLGQCLPQTRVTAVPLQPQSSMALKFCITTSRAETPAEFEEHINPYGEYENNGGNYIKIEIDNEIQTWSFDMKLLQHTVPYCEIRPLQKPLLRRKRLLFHQPWDSDSIPLIAENGFCRPLTRPSPMRNRKQTFFLNCSRDGPQCLTCNKGGKMLVDRSLRSLIPVLN